MALRLPCDRMREFDYGDGIASIGAAAAEVASTGKRVIHLEIGRPDFDSPARAKDAVKAALDRGEVHYTNMSGTKELRDAIADKYARDAGIKVDPEREICVTIGADEALMVTFLTILNQGDEVIVPSPYFPIYDDQIKIAGGVLVNVPSRIERAFRPDPADIERAITPRTRAILINSPNNPTGAVSTREEIEAIAEIAAKHDLIIVTDECYEKFILDDASEHVYIASLPAAQGRTFMISSSSKTWSMTGWRVGWAVMPPEVKPYFSRAHDATSTCATAFAQAGVAEALRSCDDDVASMVAHYKRRREVLDEGLRSARGLKYIKPSGAFYFYVDITGTGLGSYDFARRLLSETGVAVVPGQSFGSPDGWIRIAFCRPEDELRDAAALIADFTKKL